MKSEVEIILPMFDSMQQCSAVTGIPVSVLKRAKRAGCPAFETGSRVRLAPLLKWHFTRPNVPAEIDLARERARLTKADADARELKNQKEAGRLMDLNEVEKLIWDGLLQPLRTDLLNLPNVVAPLINPDDPHAVSKILDQQLQNILQRINSAPKAEKQ